MAFTTRKSLLAKVRAGDEVSWSDFYTAYKPLIYLCGNDCGLNNAEKEELVQQVMTEIFRKDIIGKFDPDNIPKDITFKYDPAKGRFRHYLRKSSATMQSASITAGMNMSSSKISKTRPKFPKRTAGTMSGMKNGAIMFSTWRSRSSKDASSRRHTSLLKCTRFKDAPCRTSRNS